VLIKDSLFIVKVVNEKVFFTEKNVIDLKDIQFNVSFGISGFKPTVSWLKIKVVSLDHENLRGEILSFSGHLKGVEKFFGIHPELNSVKNIKFFTKNTYSLLNSVITKTVYKTEEKPITDDRRKFEYKINVPFSGILFLQGKVCLKWYFKDLGTELEFEIENNNIRPEFEAVKSYLYKILNQEYITVYIGITILDGSIEEQTAVSDDLDKITNDLFEKVKFQIIKKDIIRSNKYKERGGNVHTLDNLISNQVDGDFEPQLFFDSENEFIDQVLEIQKTKHYKHIKFLSDKHLHDIFKVRFIVSPFSFIFLTGSNSNYYFIWETLDSEEATYIWSFKKDIESLKSHYEEIEQNIELMKKHGKIFFLSGSPENFTRIIHDYSETKDGFEKWRGQLDKVLV